MTVDNINKIISILTDVIQFDLAKQSDIDCCDQSLLGLETKYIPDEYVKFLRFVSNGLSIDGICLFGITEQKHKIYFIPSILTINQQFNDIKYLKKYLIIGQFFNLYIIYNYDNHKYELLNFINFNPILSCFSFEELFYELLIKRNE